MQTTIQSTKPKDRKASAASILCAYACVYFFWGSTFTAIRIGAAQMPALLLSGIRFLAAGVILLGWCRWRGLPLRQPPRTLFSLALIGLLLLSVDNGALVYAEKTVSSGLASLVLAATPLLVALIAMLMPRGEALPRRGWLGMGLGFVSLAVLLMPSLHSGINGNHALLGAIVILLFAALAWALGSVFSRHARLSVNSFVAAGWQMLIAGLCNTLLGTALGEWPQFHVNAASIGSLAYLITAGSLVGYSAYIYLLEHVPVAKVSSHAYVNPVVAVLLGIVVLHERPVAAEFVGMVGVVISVFLLTGAQMKGKAQSIEELGQLPVE